MGAGFANPARFHKMQRRKSVKRTCVLLALTALLITLTLLAGCARKPAASPNSSITPPPANRKAEVVKEFDQTRQQLVAWQQSLSPQDRNTLDSTGKLVISYTALKTADPAHAKLVDEFFRQNTKIALDSPRPGAPKLDLGAPDKVTFTKENSGQHTFMLDTTTGISFRAGLTPPAETGQPGK